MSSSKVKLPEKMDATELARRIAAAYISWHTGYPAVDKTLAKLSREKVGRQWITIAELLIKDLHGKPLG